MWLLMDITERLRQLRVSARLSQEQLANRLGHPQAWVSRREVGATRVKPDEIAEIAEACGYRMEMIFLPDGDGASDLSELLAIVRPEDAAAVAGLLRALPHLDASTRDFVLAQLEFAVSRAVR